MKNAGYGILIVTVATLATGCGSLARPNWLHPGPTAYQQSMAQQYDPYPENEPGPAMTGVRPRGYEKPIAEPLRARPQENASGSRWLPWNWLR